MNYPSRILVAGVGNPIRNDDGVGPYICRCVEQKKMQGITTAIYHQLHTELTEEFLQFDTVVIADAAIEGDAVEFYPLQEKQVSPVASSHHINASLLVSLARQLYQRELNVMICSVRGYDFEMGETFSAAAKKNADEAVSIILDWIAKQLV
ncbi:MAG: hydrogenase maturation protease [Chitinophagaceae bacterium]|nr:hydrogenase maturation protease [Chitinophagaceae bacterium]MBK8952715.1 hydrogenase maturation protease [Chitinophagaceae bacterium]